MYYGQPNNRDSCEKYSKEDIFMSMIAIDKNGIKQDNKNGVLL